MHVPVLLQEAIEGLDIDSGDIFVDATLGGGGHALEVARRFGTSVPIIGIDLDHDAIERTRKRFVDENIPADITYVEDSFRNLDSILTGLGIEKADKILFDLGFSSSQLEESGRGFSFQKNEPLLMTFRKPSGKADEPTAYEIVNYWNEKEIEKVLVEYGEERYAKRIAHHIAVRRGGKKIETSNELAEIIKGVIPMRHFSRIHPATKTFQALRIAVNDELEALAEGLAAGLRKLSKEGRMAVISFHSLEDRIVKNFMRDIAKEGKGVQVGKKPITASPEEVEKNSRARSAKMRILEKK